MKYTPFKALFTAFMLLFSVSAYAQRESLNAFQIRDARFIPESENLIVSLGLEKQQIVQRDGTVLMEIPAREMSRILFDESGKIWLVSVKDKSAFIIDTNNLRYERVEYPENLSQSFVGFTRNRLIQNMRSSIAIFDPEKMGGPILHIEPKSGEQFETVWVDKEAGLIYALGHGNSQDSFYKMSLDGNKEVLNTKRKSNIYMDLRNLESVTGNGEVFWFEGGRVEIDKVRITNWGYQFRQILTAEGIAQKPGFEYASNRLDMARYYSQFCELTGTGYEDVECQYRVFDWDFNNKKLLAQKRGDVELLIRNYPDGETIGSIVPKGFNDAKAFVEAEEAVLSQKRYEEMMDETAPDRDWIRQRLEVLKSESMGYTFVKDTVFTSPTKISDAYQDFIKAEDVSYTYRTVLIAKGKGYNKTYFKLYNSDSPDFQEYMLSNPGGSSSINKIDEQQVSELSFTQNIEKDGDNYLRRSVSMLDLTSIGYLIMRKVYIPLSEESSEPASLLDDVEILSNVKNDIISRYQEEGWKIQNPGEDYYNIQSNTSEWYEKVFQVREGSTYLVSVIVIGKGEWLEQRFESSNVQTYDERFALKGIRFSHQPISLVAKETSTTKFVYRFGGKGENLKYFITIFSK